MNWSKIKNIMIMILVVINVFLLADIAVTRFISAALPKGTGESFVSILEKRGITMEDGLVPSLYETRRIVNAVYYDIDYLTEAFIGEKIKYISNGQSVIATSNDKRLSVTGTGFEYTTLHEGVEKNGNDIIKAVDRLGLGNPGMYFDRESMMVKVSIDSCEVDGIYLDVTLDSDGNVASARGVWPKLALGGTDAKVSVIGAVNSICTNLPQGSHITDMEKIYVYIALNEPVITPAWRIYNQGRGYVVTAQ